MSLLLARWCRAMLGCCLFLGIGWVQASELGPNGAHIELQTDLTHMQMTTAPVSSDCPPGQHWDVVVDRCTPALLTHYELVTESCSCSCPSGYTGSCRKTRPGSAAMYGWRLPPGGEVLFSHRVILHWGSCRQEASTCTPSSEPPTVPKVGDQFDISTSALICGPSDAGYNAVTIANGYKNELIGYYRNMGTAGRCPERSGFAYWLNQWKAGAEVRAEETFGAAGEDGAWEAHLTEGYVWYWEKHLVKAINASAEDNNEAGQGGVNAANSSCQSTANRLYGAGRVAAIYVLKSGNRCRITEVH